MTRVSEMDWKTVSSAPRPLITMINHSCCREILFPTDLDDDREDFENFDENGHNDKREVQ